MLNEVGRNRRSRLYEGRDGGGYSLSAQSPPRSRGLYQPPERSEADTGESPERRSVKQLSTFAR
jgi:hypothetical protein